MKHFKTFLMQCMAVFSGLATVISCDDSDNMTPEQKPEPEPEKPSLILEQETIESPAEGGEFFIAYTLEHPVADGQIRFGQTPEWVVADAGQEGKLKFTISENPAEEPRTAKIKGSYSDLDFTVGIRQAGSPFFKISITAERESEIEFRVKPKDKEITYLCTQIEQNQFNRYSTPEEYLSSYMQGLEALAATNKLTLPQLLQQMGLIWKGDSEAMVKDLVPGRNYNICCIGYNPESGEYTTSFNKIECKTLPIEYHETSFEFKLYENGTVVGLEVTPEDDSRCYVTGVIQNEGEMDPYDVTTTMQMSLFQTYQYLQQSGLDMQTIVNGISYKGKRNFTWQLADNAKYYAFAVAVDPATGYLNSTPQLIEAHTTSVQPSDNQITIEVSDIKDYSAYAKITCTNQYDPYTFGTIPAETFAGMSSDEEILAELLSGKYRILPAKSGSRELELLRLKPNTRYYAVAWGYVNNTATTRLFKTEFTTRDVATGKASLTLEYGMYFDGDALLEQYPDLFAGLDVAGQAVLPVTAIPSGDVKSIHYTLAEGDMATLDDRTLNTALLNHGVSEVRSYFAIRYDKLHTLFGNAFDQEDVPGKLFLRKITPTREGASPVSEFRPFETPKSTRSMLHYGEKSDIAEQESAMITLK